MAGKTMTEPEPTLTPEETATRAAAVIMSAAVALEIATWEELNRIAVAIRAGRIEHVNIKARGSILLGRDRALQLIANEQRRRARQKEKK